MAVAAGLPVVPRVEAPRRKTVKMLILISAVIPLSACASSRETQIDKAPMAATASGMMLTTKPSEQVARCLSAAYRTVPQAIAGGAAVAAANGATYHVMTFSDPLDRYITRVDVFGYSDQTTSVAAACL
jgi:hypothetical protein